MRFRPALAAVVLVVGSVVAGPATPAFATHDSPDCGAQMSDYVGTFHIEDIQDVSVTFRADGTLVQRFYGEVVGTGTYTTGYRWIIFEVGGEKVVSTKVECADPCASRVTRIEAFDGAGVPGAIVR